MVPVFIGVGRNGIWSLCSLGLEGVGYGPGVRWGWKEGDVVPVFVGDGRRGMWSPCLLGLEEEWGVVLVFHGVGKGVGCGIRRGVGCGHVKWG